MPLYIRHTDNLEEKVVETEYILSRNHCLPKIDNLSIVEIEASGIELEHFVQLLSGLIRSPKRDVVRWEGDLARIIWGILVK